MDFLMLEYYGDIYKDMLGEKEGPRLMVKEEGENCKKYIKDIEESELYIEGLRR